MGRQLLGKDKRIAQLEKELAEDAVLLKDCKKVILELVKEKRELEEELDTVVIVTGVALKRIKAGKTGRVVEQPLEAIVEEHKAAMAKERGGDEQG